MGAQAATNPRASAFFEELRETWQQAADRVGAVERRRYRVAGNELELLFAGDALVLPLTRALAHLAAAHGTGEPLTIYAWDSTSTQTAMPRPPWGADDYREYGKIRGFFDERVQCVFQWGSRSLVMLDLERDEAVYWVGEAEQIPFFEMAAPLRLVLQGWLASRGVELVHAAAVGLGDHCVLLAGKSGAGKSWATLAATAAGLEMLADDYCLACSGTPIRIASLYSSAKTHAEALEPLPFLGGMVSNPVRPGSDKAVFFLHEHAQERLLLEAGLRAILIPRLGADETALRPAPAAAGLAALAPNTVLQLPAAGAGTLQRLAEIAREVPSHFLDLGPDIAATAPAIASLLEPAAS